jgi:hypothetical protein
MDMKHLALVLGLVLLLAPAAQAAEQAAAPEDAAAVTKDMKAAIEKVAKIVNQPVVRLPRTGDTTGLGLFSPGWFHPGAIKPDFDHVDVRKSQELTYQQYVYVSSDLNPTEMFIGRDLEFNAMTKYFYLDRSLPKKRLTEAEMVEINRLYRIIGADERKLAELRGEKPADTAGPAETTARPSFAMSFIRNILIIGVIAVAAVVFMGTKKKA